MKQALVVLLFLVVSAGCHHKSASHASGGKASGQDAAGAEAAIAQAMDQYTEALLTKDIPMLERLWADDLVFVNPRGEVRTKAQRLADMKSGATSFTRLEILDESIRITGSNSGLSTSRGKIDAKYSGRESKGEFRITVAMRRDNDGQWRIHVIHMTPIAAGQ